jgi:hypothetical protein
LLKQDKHTRRVFRWVKSLVKFAIKSEQDRDGFNWLKDTNLCFCNFEFFCNFKIEFFWCGFLKMPFSNQLHNFKQIRMAGCIFEILIKNAPILSKASLLRQVILQAGKPY